MGFGSAIGTACVVSYYASIMALTVFYFFASFKSVLPWAECDPAWVNVGSRVAEVGGLYCSNMTNMTDKAYLIYNDTESTMSLPQLYFEYVQYFLLLNLKKIS